MKCDFYPTYHFDLFIYLFESTQKIQENLIVDVCLQTMCEQLFEVMV